MSDQTPPDGSQGSGVPPHPEGYADDARRYRLDSRIATGGMGEVWRGTDEVLDRSVAVKLLKTELADDAGFRTRFETEARNAARLQHGGVAGVFDYGQAAPRDGSTTPRPYLVMELVDGQPLSALLRPDAGMPPEICVPLLAQAADAIGAAHAVGLVHRDVKPANLLVTSDRRVKITDFGIARAAEGVALTQTGQVMGTPQYLAPEQAEGRQAVPASDVYALACVAFECLTGRRPFTGESSVAVALAHVREPVPELPDDVPSDLAAVVRRGLAKDPADRYADGAAFAAALRDPATAAGAVAAVPPPVDDASATSVMPATTAVPETPRPAPTPSTYRTTRTEQKAPDRRQKRGVPAWLPIAALVLLAVLAVIVVALAFGSDDTDEDPVEPEPTTQTSDPADDQEQDPAPQPEPEPEPEPTTPDAPEPTPTEEPPSEEPTPDEPTISEDPVDPTTAPSGEGTSGAAPERGSGDRGASQGTGAQDTTPDEPDQPDEEGTLP